MALMLSACATNGVGLSGNSDRIQADLAPVCPTPTRWTVAQRTVVAKTIERNANDQGMISLAGEWDRLNSGAKICRGEP